MESQELLNVLDEPQPLLCSMNWHRWSKWSEPVQEVESVGILKLGIAYKRQERRCLACNKYIKRLVD